MGLSVAKQPPPSAAEILRNGGAGDFANACKLVLAMIDGELRACDPHEDVEHIAWLHRYAETVRRCLAAHARAVRRVEVDLATTWAEHEDSEQQALGDALLRQDYRELSI